MGARLYKEFLSCEDHSRMQKATKDTISFHEYRKRTEKHLSEQEELQPDECWERSIKDTLRVLKDRPCNFAIYRVPSRLRKINEDVYNPRIVSIGPFHHGREDLLKMEEHKWRYMLSLLGRTRDQVKTLQEFTKGIIKLRDGVPGCYADDLNMNRNKLMDILLVDGCFILELFIRYSDANFRQNGGDETTNGAWMIPTIRHDLALLENQIPFSVLDLLFSILESSNGERFPYTLNQYVLLFFHSASLEQTVPMNPRAREARHVLEMLHIYYLPSSSKTDDLKEDHTWGFKHCATNLLKSGIEIEKATGCGGLLEIKFEKGVIQFPTLSIDETMETIFWNLVAFEQCRVGGTHHITSYLMLIKGLIASSKDIELLQKKKIIKISDRSRGEDVLTFFNSICREVVLKDFYFAKICEDVNHYTQSWWHFHRIKAHLGVPWCNCVVGR
ncbi:UPF0481 protein At3g47200-like [Cornus florida]|uniref:UPF0481 protein At3g47200-like n=1 Tax=Cornus florida TaxID=4283 RepID=UPI00289A8673|nr:UPF0481 protein At3g47200-like [Cornus florida]